MYVLRVNLNTRTLNLSHEYLGQYRKDYPLSPEAREHVAAECRRFIALDVIEPVSDPSSLSEATIICPWVVIVKPEKVRCCMDALANEHIAPPPFALPAFRDALQYLRPGSYMAIHDARDFFFSVPVHPDDRRFLAFVEPNSERIWRCMEGAAVRRGHCPLLRL